MLLNLSFGKYETIMQLTRLFISPPGGGAWVAYLIVGDTHINFHDLAAQHEDVKNVLQTSRLRFLTAPEFRLLFDKCLVVYYSFLHQHRG